MKTIIYILIIIASALFLAGIPLIYTNLKYKDNSKQEVYRNDMQRYNTYENQ